MSENARIKKKLTEKRLWRL